MIASTSNRRVSKAAVLLMSARTFAESSVGQVNSPAPAERTMQATSGCHLSNACSTSSPGARRLRFGLCGGGEASPRFEGRAGSV